MKTYSKRQEVLAILRYFVDVTEFKKTGKD